MATTPATDTLSLVIEALAYPWKGGRALDNLLWAAESGNLEVAWSLNAPVEVYVPLTGDEAPEWFSEAVDVSIPPCWDACNGISVEHRPGWCRTNREHADLDCYCNVPDEAWDDEDEDLAPAPVPAQEVTPDDEPF